MRLKDIADELPEKAIEILEGIDELRPAQAKAVKKGLFKDKNLLICTPTASGKTLVAEFAALKKIVKDKGKAVYIVPLKALGNEKSKHFKRYKDLFSTALTVGDIDSADPYLAEYDLIVTTSEKLDSLTRHHAPWLNEIKLVVVDEIHLLNDPGRGPTLEILLTILKQIVPKAQFIGLSATIGNPKELAEWLDAELVFDKWRPVELHKGVYFDGEIEFT